MLFTHARGLRADWTSGSTVCIYMYVCMYVRIYTDKQHLLAVGDQTGTLHILEVPWTLRHPSSGEVSGTFSLTFLLYVQHLITYVAVHFLVLLCKTGSFLELP